MIFANSGSIISLFKTINNSKIEYVLLRNINKELPSNLQAGKDIDILVRISSRTQLLKILNFENFSRIRHPHNNNIYLYGIRKFEFYKKNNLYLDICYELCCRSLNKGEWVPLDHKIQKSIWANKRFTKETHNFQYWTLGFEDEFVSLVTRAIFDKRVFSNNYVKRINYLLKKINKEAVIDKFQTVFFKFAPILFELIVLEDFDTIINNYLEFKEY